MSKKDELEKKKDEQEKKEKKRRREERGNEEIKRSVMLLVDAIVLALLLGFDQWTKYLAIDRLKNKSAFVIWDGVLELNYLENRGSAFGMLQNQKFFIIFVDVVFMAVILFFLFKLPAKRKFNIVHVLLTMVLAGGCGNMIDRLRFDYVVDFVYFKLINYPIFNVADMYIVVATIWLFFLFLFVFKEKDLEFLNFKQNRYREMK